MSGRWYAVATGAVLVALAESASTGTADPRAGIPGVATQTVVCAIPRELDSTNRPLLLFQIGYSDELITVRRKLDFFATVAPRTRWLSPKCRPQRLPASLPRARFKPFSRWESLTCATPGTKLLIHMAPIRNRRGAVSGVALTVRVLPHGSTVAFVRLTQRSASGYASRYADAHCF